MRMITEKQFLEAELQMGIHYDNPDFKLLAEKTAEQIDNLTPDKVIDYGCGTGSYSKVLHDLGYNVLACDYFKIHRDYVKEKFPELKVIARPVEADLMYFIETAEHMTDEEIYKAIDKINPKHILFSSTSEKTEYDELWNHINIKEQDEWIEFWMGLGYKKIKDLEFPTPWSMLLEKGI